MKKNDSLEKIREVISGYENIILCGHTNPDGDAVGASLSLGAALENAGKRVCVLLEECASKYSVIPRSGLIAKKEAIAFEDYLLIAVDCGDMGRLSGIEDVFNKAKCTVNIDHHASNTYFAEYNHVESDASSASEIVFRLIKGYYPVDKDIAVGLYAGLVFDTGGFRHSSTSPDTMEAAAELMRYGIPFTDIYNTIFDSRSFSELKLMSIAFDRAELFFDGKVILSEIRAEDIERVRGTNKELDAIVNLLKGVQGVNIACFLYEKSATDVKASFRGDGFDVCALAQKFGGGGHIKAAGCTISEPIEKARAMVLVEIEKRL